MEFMTVKDASVLWKIDISTIGKLLRAGKIPGATKLGGHWVIPKDTPRVLDGRTKAARAECANADREDFFRFPLYVNGEEDGFHPPLRAEEKMLRQAELEFLACEFPEAEKKFMQLSEEAENRCVRTMSLFWLCWLSGGIHSGVHYDRYFMNLEKALAMDFPENREMALLRPWLYLGFVQYQRAAEHIDFDIHYEYSPSVLPLMTYLTYADKSSVEKPETYEIRASLYEIAVLQFTSSGNLFEAQLLHLALFIYYFMTANEERMMPHLKRAMEIAYQNDFVYFAADAYPYYASVFNRVLKDYPQEFADKVVQCGLQIDKSFSAFSKKENISDIFYLLSNSEIQFVLYAVQGISNRQIAGMIHSSQRTVAGRYTAIYEKLGVSGKADLLEKLKIR